MGWVFTNDPVDKGSIPDQVISMTQKIVLDTSLLNTQHYKVGIKGKKWSNPGKGVAPLPTPQYSTYWKESLRVALDLRQLTLLTLILYIYIYIHIYIYMCVCVCVCVCVVCVCVHTNQKRAWKSARWKSKSKTNYLLFKKKNSIFYKYSYESTYSWVILHRRESLVA